MSLRPPGLHPPTFDHCILIFLWETTSTHCVLVGGTVSQGALLRCQGTDTWLNLSQCNSRPAFWILNVWSKAKKGGREARREGGKRKEERKGCKREGREGGRERGREKRKKGWERRELGRGGEGRGHQSVQPCSFAVLQFCGLRTPFPVDESVSQPKNFDRCPTEWLFQTTQKLSHLLWFQPHLLLKLDQNPKGHFFSDPQTFYRDIENYWRGQKTGRTQENKKS